ncbi:hypothetical protein SDC9_55839 [bioreactor metagenome]|uniref:Uncharacterized protein n=1 Tax=bioreactor metagenome TaxID=1076179 RepID=A0A644X0A8_9ZZZZ
MDGNAVENREVGVSLNLLFIFFTSHRWKKNGFAVLPHKILFFSHGGQAPHLSCGKFVKIDAGVIAVIFIDAVFNKRREAAVGRPLHLGKGAVTFKLIQMQSFHKIQSPLTIRNPYHDGQTKPPLEYPIRPKPSCPWYIRPSYIAGSI